ncbi:ferredoxin--NADP reductase [Pontibacter akesuensis]|uniref:Ring-1,2-phenylacetyl-CoA epoxidase subunit PaaE n=1 Tax=Pontibacter akesuensis TaxID=388950 RepID=A0A1I7KWG4_9BACT|nr:ferredoxin--NADP reductase [Pontibacter akesuensis]GHA80544.1 flavodoxin reductase [Pontibacter akesuensis]SFV01767.1 ring-1,2-phenylacetyl-CoA epoxidase subunit PaaE [Pontibacter akesuensis]
MAEHSADSKDYYTLTIAEIKAEAPDFKTFLLAPDKPLNYSAGQYLTLVHTDGFREERRSYSITSSPALQEPLGIGVKRIPNGFFSRKLVDEAQVGDVLYAAGAAGLFVLPEDMQLYRHVFLIAAGSGITPVYSLLKTILHTQPHLRVTLIYSNRTPAHAIFRKELQQLADAFPDRFTTEFLYSNSPDLVRARLYRDLLLQFLRQHATAAPEQILCYLCGPFNYMRMCYYALRQANVPQQNIRRENFNTSKVAVAQQPPDTRPHRVTLYSKGKAHALTVQYPDTILRAARKAGLPMPYSCEAGKCGNCTARCTSGKVWMSYNEVLTEKDLAKGLVLTCVGYPVGGDVQLETP